MAGAENDQTRCVDFECPCYAQPFRRLPDSPRPVQTSADVGTCIRMHVHTYADVCRGGPLRSRIEGAAAAKIPDAFSVPNRGNCPMS